jgi:sugar phosphate isomerase/epimerase
MGTGREVQTMHKFVLSAFADEITESLDRQMDVLERYGIRHIELRTADAIPVAKYTLPQAREARRRMEDRGFAVSAVGSPIGKVDIREDFAPHLDLFRHVLDLAHALGTGYIRLFSFFMPAGEDPALYRDEVLARMARFVQEARGTGITLLHENEKEIYGDTPERCLDLLSALDAPELQGIFDFSNFVQCGAENFPHGWELLRSRIAYFHLKDSVYTHRQSGRDLGRQVTGNEHRPVGQGDGCCRQILTLAARAGFNGFCSIEPHLGEQYGATGE